MKNRELIKKCKKIIRYRHDSTMFYYLDRYLKFTRVKIEALDKIKDIDAGSVYRVHYKFGLNLWNPLSWVIVMLIFFMYIINGIKEFIEEFDVNLDEFSEVYKIKKGE